MFRNVAVAIASGENRSFVYIWNIITVPSFLRFSKARKIRLKNTETTCVTAADSRIAIGTSCGDILIIETAQNDSLKMISECMERAVKSIHLDYGTNNTYITACDGSRSFAFILDKSGGRFPVKAACASFDVQHVRYVQSPANKERLLAYGDSKIQKFDLHSREGPPQSTNDSHRDTEETYTCLDMSKDGRALLGRGGELKIVDIWGPVTKLRTNAFAKYDGVLADGKKTIHIGANESGRTELCIFQQQEPVILWEGDIGKEHTVSCMNTFANLLALGSSAGVMIFQLDHLEHLKSKFEEFLKEKEIRPLENPDDRGGSAGEEYFRMNSPRDSQKSESSILDDTESSAGGFSGRNSLDSIESE